MALKQQIYIFKMKKASFPQINFNIRVFEIAFLLRNSIKAACKIMPVKF